MLNCHERENYVSEVEILAISYKRLVGRALNNKHYEHLHPFVVVFFQFVSWHLPLDKAIVQVERRRDK